MKYFLLWLLLIAIIYPSRGQINQSTLINNLDSGMKVTLTGIVQEFPDNILSTPVTQLKLDTLTEIQILPTIKKRPAPIQVNVSDFYSLGIVKVQTGEKYEGMYVQINNVSIGP